METKKEIQQNLDFETSVNFIFPSMITNQMEQIFFIKSMIKL